MQLAIIKKKQCDAKALAIVEQLLEPEVDSQWLLSNLKYINKSHMEDVIEERAIIKLCGYVLCNNPLTKVINQQYHISTKKNKVYDVSLRKNFCSSSCFGACKYLLEQMLTSPLWLREKEEIPEFKILLAPDKLRSAPGDEIDVRDISTVDPDVKNDDEQDETIIKDPVNVRTVINAHGIGTVEENVQPNPGRKFDISEQYSNNFEEQCKDMEDPCTHINEKNNLDTEFNTQDSTPNIRNVESANNSTTSKDIGNKEQIGSAIEEDTISNKDSVEKINQSKQKKHKKNLVKDAEPTEFYNLATRIEVSAREWITEDTICLLSGKEDDKTRLLENIIQQDRYLHLCKRLNKLQLEDEKDDNINLTMNSLKPLPDLSALQEEGKKIELKVQSFYKGSTVIDNRSSTETKEQDNFTPVLPLIDAHAPKAIRRRIFLDKLNRILPDLLRMLSSNRLPQYVYNSEKSTLIKALVNTFSLSAANIVFKTAEWTLVGLIIIKMLSLMDPQLKTVLSTKQASLYISMILMSYKLDPNYLDRLVMELIGGTETSSTDNFVI
ncbi:putative RNA polymerase II subunit B1 CTD phosphatase RPAP2 isoform X2 [Ceratina calcarata]|nr:putative RNA polymerase II subunit B1 CTD phosphatase RPAP2 isoform X2 [Ceratina calcarata]